MVEHPRKSELQIIIVNKLPDKRENQGSKKLWNLLGNSA